MINKFEIQRIYNIAFGYRGAPYPLGYLGSVAKLVPMQPDINFDKTSTPDRDKVVEDLMDGLNHRSAAGAVLFMPVSINDVQLPNEPTISLSIKKTIIETVLAGNTRRGTVKEIINTEDWDITIRGVCINEGNTEEYPTEQVKQLKDIFEQNKSLSIKCALTDWLDISKIVIRSFSLPEMKGVQHAQVYEMQCVSDEDFLLIKE